VIAVHERIRAHLARIREKPSGNDTTRTPVGRTATRRAYSN
jgi:hypothetical protein